MTIQTQTITRGAWGTDLSRVLTRTAIPWCTTHDSICALHQPSNSCDRAWYRNYGAKPINDPCTISTGGPDHKWWEDMEERRTL